MSEKVSETAHDDTVRPLRITVVCPHFEPDTAPTGDVMTRIVHELAALGHELHVVTSLPWYRNHAVEPGWSGRLVRRESTAWGTVTRIDPFAARDRRNLLRRALAFGAFSAVAAVVARRIGRADAVIAMSPPLTLGVAGWIAAARPGGRLVFNIQDVFPDAAVRTGAITNRYVIAAARRLERFVYARAAAVTVLSDDLRDNVAAKLRPDRRSRVRVIPNFVDTAAISPQGRRSAFRAELGVGEEPVVMYAGNVGFSQSLELLLAAARELPAVTFVVNGDGSAREELARNAASLPNVRFSGYQPRERLAEVLASADVHVVPLRTGLGSVSVPSKTYSILAAGRPVLAAIDPGTEVTRILAASGAGRAVAPDDPRTFTSALREMLADPQLLHSMGDAGRRWVETAVSPRAVAIAYEELIREVRAR